MPRKRRPGRPSKPASERRDRAIRILATGAEEGAIVARAASAGMPLSEYGRRAMLGTLPTG